MDFTYDWSRILWDLGRRVARTYEMASRGRRSEAINLGGEFRNSKKPLMTSEAGSDGIRANVTLWLPT
jgi:hypothetical protein